MAISWPTTVPYKSDEGYAMAALGLPPISSEMQNGRRRQRPRSTMRITTIKWSRNLEPAELGAFRTFVHDTLGQGCARFTMPVWNAPTQTFVDRVCIIVGGESGITEEDRVAWTLVTMTLEVENL
jgi:hypothetical protein